MYTQYPKAMKQCSKNTGQCLQGTMFSEK